ncbi:MAG: DUF2723 domain-containing protein, partial [Desulfobacterales bacterium]|nr:DUF2723 domain-containing protein [Desulfobacterales bacterium]
MNDTTGSINSAAAGWVVFLIPFGGYLFTLSPSVYVGDSGEFIAAAFSLGIAHNPGYPLYALAGKLFALIPLGNIAFRLNLMSAFFGAMAVWITFQIICRLTRSQSAAVPAALLFAFSATLWSQTGMAEVYALHMFLVALLVRLLVGWHETGSFARLVLFAFVVGLSFGNHMQTVMLAPAMLFFVIRTDPETLFNLRRLFFLIFFFMLGLSIYIYLPVRTEAGAAIHWGDPDSLKRFFHHVTAADHRSAYTINQSGAAYALRLAGAMKDLLGQYHLLTVFALIGWMGRNDLKHKIFWVLVIIFDLTYTVFLNTIALEITPFQLSSVIVLAILIGQGIARVLQSGALDPPGRGR